MLNVVSSNSSKISESEITISYPNPLGTTSYGNGYTMPYIGDPILPDPNMEPWITPYVAPLVPWVQPTTLVVSNTIQSPWKISVVSDKLSLKLDLAGVSASDLSVEISESSVVKVVAKRFDSTLIQHYQYGIEAAYDTSKAKATFEHCVLEILVPKKSKPSKKLTVVCK